ncbi:amino acid transporter AVT1C-like [Rhagoletis pomonella]|uniref:amino acid transporter AVT1C-like n=1 Tax=Rhagoletis pomonella TaxID=28610 RepID=UPI00177FFD7F|nr:amino acid transporter AVT1C-like [Rhagoletis pomonella]
MCTYNKASRRYFLFYTSTRSMFFKRRHKPALRPSKAYYHSSDLPSLPPSTQSHNDQLPFLSRARFSALPHLQIIGEEKQNLTLLIAVLYIIDLFGVLPFITLPSLLVQLGVLGIPLVLSIIVLQIYTSFLLSQCWIMAESFDPSITQKSRYPYAAIADLAYGRCLSIFVRILLDISIFATAIPSLVLAAQNLELVGERITDNEFSFSFCYWVIILGIFCCPLMWLRSPKYMRGLAIFSLIVLIVIVILLWFCLFASAPLGKPFEGVSLELPSLLALLNGYSILAFQFDIHPMLLTLQIDMQQKSQVYWAAFSGITVTCAIAIFGSIIAIYKFGTMIADNLLESLPKSLPLYFLLILIAVQLCFSIIVGSSAMFLQIENYLHIREAFSWKRIALRSSVVGLEVLIAEFVPNFGVLMDIVGGTIIAPLVFILPPLLYRRIRRMERVHQRFATESSYGSIPLDLNFESVHTDMEQLLMLEQQQQRGVSLSWRLRLRKSWLHILKCWYGLKCDFTASLSVMVFGVLATIISTYLNIFSLADLFRYEATCFFNMTKDVVTNQKY